MKLYQARIIWPIACVLLSIPTTVSSGSSLKYKTPPPTHHQSVIAAVTSSSVTVTNQTLSDKGKLLDKKSQTFAITRYTEINVNSQRATAADLKPGMKVKVTAAMDRSQAARIDANG